MREMTASKLRIGGVLKTSFSILLRNIIPFGLTTIFIVFICYSISTILRQYLFSIIVESISLQQYRDHLLGFDILRSTFIRLLNALPHSFLAAALVCGSITHMRGQKASARICVRQGFANLRLVFGVMFVSTLLFSTPRLTLAAADFLGAPLPTRLGALFYLVGVVMLIVKLAIHGPIWLAVPVAIVEKRGVLASFGRSFRLTKGDRWRIFVLLLLFWGLPTLSGKLTSAVVSAARDVTVTYGLGLVQMIFSSLVISLGTVAMAVSYDAIRRSKEGLGADEIATVFD